LNCPARAAFDGANYLYIADQANNKIRALNLTTGNISTVIATGTPGFAGDGGSALMGEIYAPCGIAVNKNGNIYLSDGNNRRIRTVPYSESIVINLAGPASVLVGTPVTFTTFTSANTTVSFQWQRNSENVGSGLATYTDSMPADGNVYTCIMTVSPECGSSVNDTSNSIIIHVAEGRQESNHTQLSKLNKDLRIYPNPFGEYITVSSTNFENGTAELHVADQMGKLVLKKSVDVNNSYLLEELDMRELATGLYFISIIDSKGELTVFKCIKDH
jgi:hypothetical protein